MRKIAQFYDTDKPDPTRLLLAVDVSSRRLDLYSRYRQGGTEYEVSESFPNEVPAIADRLAYYARQARGLSYRGPSFDVEPSDRYEKKLTGAALKDGHSVWVVNPERMYKAKVACMRKLLKILYGAAKSNQPFNLERVYHCAG